MSTTPAPSQRIRGYLLGQLSEEDHDSVELSVLSDEATFEGVLDTEDELIEEYLAGGLSAPEREQFERYFLASPEHRVSTEAARRLRAYFVPAPKASSAPIAPRRMPWLALAAGLGTVGVAGVLALMLYRPAGVEQAGAARPAATTPKVEAPAPQTPAQAAPAAPQPVVASLEPLWAGRTMGASDGAATLRRIPAGASQVDVRLALGDATDATYPRYRVEIRTEAGTTVWRSPSLRPHTSSLGTLVTPRVPAERLTGRSYRIELLGERDGAFEPAGTYYLSLAR
jgi:hypothetical protein